MAKLRGYVFLDRLQPQLMSLIGATCRGYLPRANEASLTVEVAPGMDVEWLTDVALKHDDVKPGVLVVERTTPGAVVIRSKSNSLLSLSVVTSR